MNYYDYAGIVRKTANCNLKIVFFTLRKPTHHKVCYLHLHPTSKQFLPRSPACRPQSMVNLQLSYLK